MPTLIIANKAYSSWSLRPWIAMTHFDIAFDEIVIPLDQPETRDAILAHSPTGKCPVLVDGPITVWESLAILEYLADTNPQKPIWPRDTAARALARSLASEMHAGFASLRTQCPMNMRRKPKAIAWSEATLADVARLEAAWARAFQTFGGNKPFLLGDFCAADAMFAPVVNRLHVYDLPVGAKTRAYMDAMMALPAWKAWAAAGLVEPWFIEKYESL